MKKYILQIKKYIILEVTMDLICAICIAFAPVLQKQLFDHVAESGLRVLVSIVVAYIMLALCYVCASYFCLIFTWKGAINFEKNMKKDFFRAVFNMKKDDFQKKPVGEYISLQGNDITALEQDYLQPFTDIVRSVNMFVVYSIVLFVWVDWRIAVVIILTSLFSVAGPRITGKIMSEKRSRYQQQMAEYVTKITDLLEGFGLINAHTRKNINQQHENALDETADARYKYGKAKSVSLTINEFALKLIEVAAFITAGVLLVLGKITIGTGVATFGYVSSFIEPINSILYDVNAIQSVSEVKDKFLAYVNGVKVPDLEKMDKLCSEIVVEHLDYSIGDYELKDLCVRFEKGKKYAIIGRSGAGKSTLLKLLMGYITPRSGRILIDGKDLSGLDTSELIAYVDQNEHIYRTGFADNVTVFDSYSTQKAKLVQQTLGMKIIDTIQSRGDSCNCQDLSGGEKQTLVFLRMMAKDADIILLDEPFSAVDAVTKEKLEQYLLSSREMNGKTLLMVTHDISEQALAQFDEVVRVG